MPGKEAGDIESDNNGKAWQECNIFPLALTAGII